MMDIGTAGIEVQSLLIGCQRLLIALASIEGITLIEPLFFRLLKHARSPYLSLMSDHRSGSAEGSQPSAGVWGKQAWGACIPQVITF